MSSPRKDSVDIVEKKPSYRWVILALSWLLYFSFGLIYTTLSILVTPVMNDLNLTYWQMGMILGSWQLVYIFFAQPAGILIDYLGPYKSLFIGSIMISLSSALRWYATTFESLFIFVALFGLGGPLISIGLPKLVSIWFVGRERGTASGVYTTGNTIGGMVALSITNSLIMPIVRNWKHVFLIYAVISFLIAVTWVFLGRRSPDVKATMTRSTKVEGQWHSIWRLFQSKNLWLIVGIGITFFLTLHGLSSWLPTILEIKGISTYESGVIVSFLNLFGICGSILLPKLQLYLQSKKWAIAITLFTLSLAILIFGFTSGISMWIGISCTWFFMRGLLPLLLVTLMDLPDIGSEHMGVVGGLYFSIGEIGGFGGPFLMGFFKDITGSFLLGIIFLVVVTQIAIVCTVYLKLDASINSSVKC